MLDQEKGTVTVLAPTAYGRRLRTAVGYYARGEYRQSVELWEQLLRDNSHLSLAYRSIGKAYYQQGEYARSLPYFQKSHDRDGYSKAYREVRKEFIRRNLIWLVPAAVVIWIALKRLVRLVRRKVGLYQERRKTRKRKKGAEI